MSISMKSVAPRKSVPFRLLALACAGLCALSHPALASSTENINVMGIDLSKIDKPSAVPFLPEAEFQSATRAEAEGAPYDDSALAYEIRIPKDWTENVQGGFGEIQTDNKALSDSVLSNRDDLRQGSIHPDTFVSVLTKNHRLTMFEI